ncbi:hypothetical protein PoB_000228200 [Plakobranchus ocellatus]|uniref:Uncharacterized protein n=1 Tax=Plakobranchus ocellatus TaxID=259542 RepID=A0AAV3Y021_9GAST|nr:hypothetical protein PoB_000228200 [Plakobranchus ocellatus]
MTVNYDHVLLHQLQRCTNYKSSFQGVSESTLRCEGTLLSGVRASPLAPWPDREPESLRSPCCGLAIFIKSQPSLYIKSRTQDSTHDLDRRSSLSHFRQCSNPSHNGVSECSLISDH